MHTDETAVAGLGSSFQLLHSYLAARAFRGYEFDDILGSGLVRRLAGPNLMLQRIAIQVARRSPVNLRPALGVKKLDSSKARGYFAKGYLYRYLATQSELWLRMAEEHLAWLLQNYCRDYTGMSWGNAFDFASRGGLIRKGTPTIVWTAHISESFDLAYQHTGAPRYRDAVLKVGQFIVENVGRNVDSSGVCLGYVPGATSVIHNSNLLGAVALLRAWQRGADQSYHDLARKAIEWSCARMSPGGGWYYGDSEGLHWIDNFHTGYNLDCLVAAQDIAGRDFVRQEVIDRTYRYWVEHFFLPNGRPRYYADRPYPVDIQCAAQAIESLAKYADRDPAALELSMLVAQWTTANMQKSNGAFALRKGRLIRNGLESIHWGQSTMLSALACLLWQLDVR